MAKKKSPKKDAEVHEDLKGFEINIDPFGNIQTNMSIEKIKKFLDKNIDDKKVDPSGAEEE